KRAPTACRPRRLACCDRRPTGRRIRFEAGAASPSLGKRTFFGLLSHLSGTWLRVGLDPRLRNEAVPVRGAPGLGPDCEAALTGRKAPPDGRARRPSEVGIVEPHLTTTGFPAPGRRSQFWTVGAVTAAPRHDRYLVRRGLSRISPC